VLVRSPPPCPSLSLSHAARSWRHVHTRMYLLSSDKRLRLVARYADTRSREYRLTPNDLVTAPEILSVRGEEMVTASLFSG